MRPSFRTRMLAFLGLSSVPHATSSDRYRERLEKVARIPNHEPVQSATRAALDMMNPYNVTNQSEFCPSVDPTDEPSNFALRYPLKMPEDAMRRQAWHDDVKHRQRIEGQSATIRDTDNALIAATNRADMLNAAIQYAVSFQQTYPAIEWLVDWNEGDENADNELREWINGPGKAVLGEAVAGRVGLPPVPPTVGRERPEPASVFSPSGVTPYTYKGEPPAVPVHPATVGIFRQTPEQRGICSHRVTRNLDNVETCNWPRAGIARCSGCPLLTR